MTNKVPDWEKELKNKPLRRRSFTPQMMQRVEEEAKKPTVRTSKWMKRAGVLTLGAALLSGGILLERYGAWDGLRQLPRETSIGKSQLPRTENGGEGAGTVQGPARGKKELAFPEKNGDGETTGTVSIPLNFLKAELAIGEPENDSVPETPRMTFALTAKEAEALQAVLVHRPDDGSGYVLLVPRSWQAAGAWIGANGSIGADFVNPDNPGDPDKKDPGSPGERLRYSETFSGSSVASGMGTYFPDRKKWTEEQGFGVMAYEGVAFRSLYVNENEETGLSRYDWTRQGQGPVASGAAYYSLNQQNYTLRNLEISLEGTAYSQTADTILRFFEANEGAQRVEASKP